ncbi:MAG: xanthine dehydrogenase family protein molybdopterin-binding subunit [Rhodospirillaceae bacterium]|nr:xanthine dehydrogenase family protein molybdopterin-binding subunit [Rhodospirillaceae bacterium]
MTKFGVGQGVPRWEDPRLLRGGGRYSDDQNRPGQAYGYVVRSPHAHARILSIDTADALAAPGVLRVYTGDDMAEYGSVPCLVAREKADGSPMFTPPNRPLRQDRVRYVGDYVAFVVAESHTQARDAAELVAVDYEPLPSVTDTEDTVRDGAPAVWDEVPDNVCFVFEQGDSAAVENAIQVAHHVTTLDIDISRVAVAPMEPRTCIGEYDKFNESFTLYTGTQGPHLVRQAIAEPMLHVPQNRLRVVSEDMGGAFGMRSGPYCENLLCMHAAKDLDRPVKWTGDRTEHFLVDDQARDNRSKVELALDADGTFLAFRVTTTANLGAYLTMFGPHSSTNNLGTLAGTYTTPAIYTHVTGVFSNTPSTGPYRGAGRPEAAYVLERAIDTAAAELNIEPAELRRRNYIPESAIPFQTGLVFNYDSGQFEKNMDTALDMIGYDGFAARQDASKAAGKLRGIGISNVIEQAAGGFPEWAEIRFDPSGTVTVVMGTHNHGQGHETVFRQMLADKLGLEFEQIRYQQGDTIGGMAGTGTFGSRSTSVGGSSLLLAADKVVDKARRMASHQLEAAEDDLEFADGTFTVAGTDRTITLTECAKLLSNFMTAPPGMDVGLNEWASWRPPAPNFPNGCHVAEVEIDPETGTLDIARYVAVDDVGTVLNPLLLDGQLHGGIVQGVGQILSEDVSWDRESGQMITASFMDYVMPRADMLPNFETAVNEDAPTPTNAMGIKGAGEAGCVGAMPALMNAIVNALRPAGVSTLDMPATPQRIWQALQEAKTS